MRQLLKAEQAIIVIALDSLQTRQPFAVPTAKRLADEMRNALTKVWIEEAQ